MSQADEEIQKLINRSAVLAEELRRALARSKDLRREADQYRRQIKTERVGPEDGAGANSLAG